MIHHVRLDQRYVKRKSTNQKLTLGLILHVHFLLFDYGRIDQTRIKRNSTNQTFRIRLCKCPHSKMMTEISIGHRECNMYQILETKEDKSIHGPAQIERTQRDF